jgi:hypothetical protein
MWFTGFEYRTADGLGRRAIVKGWAVLNTDASAPKTRSTK